jgi:hypothetical protein
MMSSLLRGILSAAVSAPMLLCVGGFEAVASDDGGAVEKCADLDFGSDIREGFSPVSLLENGRYTFDGNKPLPKWCLQKRVCEVDRFTREQFRQSYRISLEEPGGAEIKRQFPDLVNDLAGGRPDEAPWLYLYDFCRAVDEDYE